VSSTLRKYNISGTIYATFENEADKVIPNMKIELLDDDHGFNSDDDLGYAVTDEQGHFEGLVGEEDEEEEQEPYISIPMDYCFGELKVSGLLFQPYNLNKRKIFLLEVQ
jgi:hypothetical protein